MVASVAVGLNENSAMFATPLASCAERAQSSNANCRSKIERQLYEPERPCRAAMCYDPAAASFHPVVRPWSADVTFVPNAENTSGVFHIEAKVARGEMRC